LAHSILAIVNFERAIVNHPKFVAFAHKSVPECKKLKAQSQNFTWAVGPIRNAVFEGRMSHFKFHTVAGQPNRWKLKMFGVFGGLAF
jgi:hypothetical protein